MREGYIKKNTHTLLNATKDKVVSGRSRPHYSSISLRQMISVISKVLADYNNKRTKTQYG